MSCRAMLRGKSNILSNIWRFSHAQVRRREYPPADICGFNDMNRYVAAVGSRTLAGTVPVERLRKDMALNLGAGC
jgi:hypothetical protein